MLRDILQKGEFAVTCEFVPGRGKDGPSVEAAIEFAKEASTSGIPVHAVSLTDNPGGNPAILPEALALEVRKHGMDSLVHFSCRDLNRNGMESRLMALSRAGISNLLIVTGDYPASGYDGHATGVFDLDAVQAIRYVKAMNAGLEVPGGKKGTTLRLSPTSFFVGAAVSPFKMTERELLPQYFKLEKKIAAGADFIVTQLGYDMRKFLEVKRYMTARNLHVPLIGNVYVLSAGAARVMHAGSVPGCVVSDGLLRVLEAESQDPDKGKGKRLERAAKMTAMFKGMGFSGVHIGGFALKAADIRFIIERAAEIGSDWQKFVPEVSFSREGEFYAFPPPKSYASVETDDDPARRPEKGNMTFSYSVARGMHKTIFEPASPGCRLMTRYYKAVDCKSFLGRLSHRFEFFVKELVFACRNCGDCALPDMAYCCPMGQCAKKQRNGPCGGSRDGMCEVYPDEKPCVWTVVYQRLKSVGRLEDMRMNYVGPRRAQLDYTSGWANYFLKRDHAGVSEPAAEAGHH